MNTPPMFTGPGDRPEMFTQHFTRQYPGVRELEFPLAEPLVTPGVEVPDVVTTPNPPTIVPADIYQVPSPRSEIGGLLR